MVSYANRKRASSPAPLAQRTPKKRTTRTAKKAMKSLITYELGTIRDAQANQWTGDIPAGGMPHIACIALELFNKIAEYCDKTTLAILSVTCKALRIRLPYVEYAGKMKLDLDGNMERVALDDYVKDGHGQETNVRMWELLKGYMSGDFLAGIKRRDYAGNYGVYRFLDVKRYKAIRDTYWTKYPQMPADYTGVMMERGELEEEVMRRRKVGHLSGKEIKKMTTKELEREILV